MKTITSKPLEVRVWRLPCATLDVNAMNLHIAVSKNENYGVHSTGDQRFLLTQFFIRNYNSQIVQLSDVCKACSFNTTFHSFLGSPWVHSRIFSTSAHYDCSIEYQPHSTSLIMMGQTYLSETRRWNRWKSLKDHWAGEAKFQVSGMHMFLNTIETDMVEKRERNRRKSNKIRSIRHI